MDGQSSLSCCLQAGLAFLGKAQAMQVAIYVICDAGSLRVTGSKLGEKLLCLPTVS